jgi:hypothetical protein
MTDEELLDQISRVRAHNNTNWMDILRIAMRADPKATKEVLGKILVMDLEVSRLMRAMASEDWKPRNLDKSPSVPDR